MPLKATWNIYLNEFTSSKFFLIQNSGGFPNTILGTEKNLSI